MTKLLSLFFLLAVTVATALGQISGGGGGGAGAVYTGVLTGIPATCVVGQTAFITDATPGQNLYYCTATNTWTQQLNSGAGGASTALDNLVSPAVNATVTPGTTNLIDLGSTSKIWRAAYLNSAIAAVYNTVIIKADQSSGADAVAKLNACATAAASAAGICDGTAITGAQTGATLTVPTNVELRLGQISLTLSSHVSKAAGAKIIGAGPSRTVIACTTVGGACLAAPDTSTTYGFGEVSGIRFTITGNSSIGINTAALTNTLFRDIQIDGSSHSAQDLLLCDGTTQDSIYNRFEKIYLTTGATSVSGTGLALVGACNQNTFSDMRITIHSATDMGVDFDTGGSHYPNGNTWLGGGVENPNSNGTAINVVAMGDGNTFLGFRSEGLTNYINGPASGTYGPFALGGAMYTVTNPFVNNGMQGGFGRMFGGLEAYDMTGTVSGPGETNRTRIYTKGGDICTKAYGGSEKCGLAGTYTVAGADYLLTSTGANAATFEQVNGGVSCGDGTHATSYNATTHQFGCQALTTYPTSVNGSGVTSPNFNSTTPAAQANNQNIVLQVSGSSVSLEVPQATTGQAGLVQLAGDLGGAMATPSVLKVNGTSVPTNAAADQLVVTTASATGAWKSVADCQDSAGNHLNYTASTHEFSCGTTSSASGVGGSGAATQLGIWSGTTALTGYSGLTWTTGTNTLALPAGSVIKSADTGAPSITFGTNLFTFNQPVSFAGSVGFAGLTEGADPSANANCKGAGIDCIYADSTNHRLMMHNNNGATVQVVGAAVDINNSDQVTATHLAAPLPVGQGGTGVASPTIHALMVGNGSSAMNVIAPGAANTVLMGQGAADPAYSTAVPSCTADATHALQFNTTSHAFECNAITATAAAGGSDGQIQVNNSTALAGYTFLTTNKTDTVFVGVSNSAQGKLGFYGTGGAGSVNLVAPTNPSGTLTLFNGTGTIAATTGTLTNGNITKFDSSGRVVDAGTVATNLVTAQNVVLLGADPTGVGDSTTAIQTALTAGGSVFVPAGTYSVTVLNVTAAGTKLTMAPGASLVFANSSSNNRLNIQASNVVIEGGGSSSVLDYSGVTTTANSANSVIRVDATGASRSNVLISNLKILGNCGTVTATCSSGVTTGTTSGITITGATANSVSNVTIQNVEISNASSMGIYNVGGTSLAANTANLKIDKVNIHDTARSGIFIDQGITGLTVSNSTIGPNIARDATSGHGNITVRGNGRGNNIYDSDIKLINNTLYGSYLTGIQLNSQDSVLADNRYTRDVLIHGNTVYKSDFTDGECISGTFSYGTISNNRVHDCAVVGILLYTPATASSVNEHVNIINNIVSNAGRKGGGAASVAIQVEALNAASVVTQHLRIAGNVCFDDQVSPTTSYCVQAENFGGSGAFSNVVFQGNMLGAGSGLALYAYGTGGATTRAQITVMPTFDNTLSLGVDNALAGTVVASNSAANAHTTWGSGATTSNTINGPATVPTTGHLLDCTTTSTTCLLHDSGLVTANVDTSAGTLTSTALMTGGGSHATQTPSATSTLDASGNLAVAAGGSVGSADTGTPKLTFATNKMTANQPLNLGVTTNQLVTGTTTNLTTVNFPASSGAVTVTMPNITSTVSITVASGAKALATSAISSAACTAAQTDTATGTATTDVVLASFNGDPTAVTGYVPLTTGMLTIIAYPTTNTVNFKVCNNTSSSITPGAITLNWRVVR